MTYESTVCVWACEWVRSLWVDVISPHPTFPSSFTSPQYLWVGYKKKPLSTDALLCVPCDVSPSAPHNYRLWRHTGTSSLLTEARIYPDFTERQNLIKSAWQSCSIVVCTLKYCYTVGSVTYLAPPCFHVSNYLMSVVFIQFHYLLIQIFLQYNVEWRTRKKKKNHRWWENAGKKQNAVNSQKKRKGKR